MGERSAVQNTMINDAQQIVGRAFGLRQPSGEEVIVHGRDLVLAQVRGHGGGTDGSDKSGLSSL